MPAGTSTPPSIAATPVPALPPPIAVNSYPSVPAPPNGQSATEALYTNGVHAYQGTAVPSCTAAALQKIKNNCDVVGKYSVRQANLEEMKMFFGACWCAPNSM